MSTRRVSAALAVLACLLASTASAAPKKRQAAAKPDIDQTQSLHGIAWHGSLQAALAHAGGVPAVHTGTRTPSAGKPVFLLRVLGQLDGLM